MRVAIVYSSASATMNTKALAEAITRECRVRQHETDLFPVDDFDLDKLCTYDVLIIGTYTWGNGEVPDEMINLYRHLTDHAYPNLVTGVFGSGDMFYPRFCGAVDLFKGILNRGTELAVVLKVELYPQKQDFSKIPRYVELIENRYNM